MPDPDLAFCPDGGPTGHDAIDHHRTVSSSPPVEDPLVAAVALDFATKDHGPLALDEVRPSMDAGRFVWIDVDVARIDEARALLSSVGLCAAAQEATVGVTRT